MNHNTRWLPMREPRRLPLLRFLPTTAIVFALLGPTVAGCDHALRGGRTSDAGITGHGGSPSSGGASGLGVMGGTGGGELLGSSPETSAGGAGGITMITVQPRTSCGDTIVERSEGCDDGNTAPGDGCSAECRIEFGWECPREGEPCIPARICGDSIIMPGEACDDGNLASDDGCSSDCRHVERGWYCRVTGRPCRPVCGDGFVLGGEVCDDGNTANTDGCSSACQRETCDVVAIGAGWPCDPSLPRPYCGDGIVAPDEECDCGSGVSLPPRCPGGNDDDAYNGCTTRCKWGPYCGDGIINGSEQCDHGGRNGFDLTKDGCTLMCTIPPHCGDGVRDLLLGEECDLGSARNGVPLDEDYEPTSGYGNILCTRDCRYVFM